MADVSDEKLMALADGELDAVEAAKLTQQIAGDPVLARRLAVFQATGDDLRRVFDQIEASPVPQRLIDAVLWSAPAGRMRELPVGPPAPGLVERLLALVSPPALGWMPAAAAAALVAVAAVSMFGRPHDEAATGAGDLAALRRTGGPALAALASVLDGARSGQISAIALEGRSIEEVFGYPDHLKFHSSITLFARAAPHDPVFQTALQKFFAGQLDPLTLDRRS